MSINEDLQQLLLHIHDDRDGIAQFLDSLDDDERQRILDQLGNKKQANDKLSNIEIVQLLICCDKSRYDVTLRTLQLTLHNTFSEVDAIHCISEIRIGYFTAAQSYDKALSCTLLKEIETILDFLIESVGENAQLPNTQGLKIILELFPFMMEIKFELKIRDMDPQKCMAITSKTISRLLMMLRRIPIIAPIVNVFVDCRSFFHESQWECLKELMETSFCSRSLGEAECIFRGCLSLTIKLNDSRWFSVARKILRQHPSFSLSSLGVELSQHHSRNSFTYLVSTLERVVQSSQFHEESERMTWTDIVFILEVIRIQNSLDCTAVNLLSSSDRKRKTNSLSRVLRNAFEAVDSCWELNGGSGAASTRCDRRFSEYFHIQEIVKKLVCMERSQSATSAKRSLILVDAAIQWILDKPSRKTVEMGQDILESVFILIPSTRSSIMATAFHAMTHFDSMAFQTWVRGMVQRYTMEVASLSDVLQTWLSPHFVHTQRLRRVLHVLQPLVCVSTACFDSMMISVRKLVGSNTEAKLIAGEILSVTMATGLSTAQQEDVVKCWEELLWVLSAREDRTKLFVDFERSVERILYEKGFLGHSSYCIIHDGLSKLALQYFKVACEKPDNMLTGLSKQKTRKAVEPTNYELREVIAGEFDEPLHKVLGCLFLLERMQPCSEAIGPILGKDLLGSILNWFKDTHQLCAVICKAVENGTTHDAARKSYSRLISTLTFVADSIALECEASIEKSLRCLVFESLSTLTLRPVGIPFSVESILLRWKTLTHCVQQFIDTYSSILESQALQLNTDDSSTLTIESMLFITRQMNEYLRSKDEEWVETLGFSRRGQSAIRQVFLLFQIVIVRADLFVHLSKQIQPTPALWQLTGELATRIPGFVESNTILHSDERHHVSITKLQMEVVLLLSVSLKRRVAMVGEEATMHEIKQIPGVMKFFCCSSHGQNRPTCLFSRLSYSILKITQEQLQDGMQLRVAISFVDAASAILKLSHEKDDFTRLKLFPETCLNILCEHDISHASLLRRFLQLMFCSAVDSGDTFADAVVDEEHFGLYKVVALSCFYMPTRTTYRKRLRQDEMAKEIDEDNQSSEEKSAEFREVIISSDSARAIICTSLLSSLSSKIDRFVTETYADAKLVEWSNLGKCLKLIVSRLGNGWGEWFSGSHVSKFTAVLAKFFKKTYAFMRIFLRQHICEWTDENGILTQLTALNMETLEWAQCMQDKYPDELHRKSFARIILQTELFQVEVYGLLAKCLSDTEEDSTAHTHINKILCSLKTGKQFSSQIRKREMSASTFLVKSVSDYPRRNSKKRQRSRHAYIDSCLREEPGEDTFADLEDFIED